MSLFDFFWGKIGDDLDSDTAFAGTLAVAGAVFILTFFGITNFPPLIPFLIRSIILTELFFWTTKRKPKKNENTFWFTLKTKTSYFLESAFWLIQANGALHAFRAFMKWFGASQDLVWTGAKTIGVLTVIVVTVFVWLKVNEKKFKKKTRGNTHS